MSRPFIPLEIPKRTARCSLGQETFESGMDYYSVVIDEKDQGLVRQDYCAGCWKHLDKAPILAKAKGHWNSQVPAKKTAQEMSKSREEKAIALLREALAADSKESAAEAFVLALFLARKKMIKACDEIFLETGLPATLYEILDAEEMICVPRIKLSDLQIDTLQESIAQKLKP